MHCCHLLSAKRNVFHISDLSTQNQHRFALCASSTAQRRFRFQRVGLVRVQFCACCVRVYVWHCGGRVAAWQQGRLATHQLGLRGCEGCWAQRLSREVGAGRTPAYIGALVLTQILHMNIHILKKKKKNEGNTIALSGTCRHGDTHMCIESHLPCRRLL
jgi:hypothetical protein